MAKYNNQKTSLAGRSFDSKLESSVFRILELRAAKGELEIVRQQACIFLTDARIQYIADFECRDPKTGDLFYVEAKGMETPVWRIKRKIWLVYGPSTLEIWKGDHKNPRLHETLIPKRKEAA